MDGQRRGKEREIRNKCFTLKCKSLSFPFFSRSFSVSLSLPRYVCVCVSWYRCVESSGVCVLRVCVCVCVCLVCVTGVSVCGVCLVCVSGVCVCVCVCLCVCKLKTPGLSTNNRRERVFR